jgi:hypothetical protein
MGRVGKLEKVAGLSSDAVKKKTGRGWAEWIALLDKAGARTKDHKGIVAILRDRYSVGSWWQQMVTVGYEQARGKREVHETAKGYQVSASKTIAVPVEKLFAAWENSRVRAKWLPGSPLIIRKATAHKSLRASWKQDGSPLDVYFYRKGDGKSQVSLQQRRLAGPAEVRRLRAFWRQALNELTRSLES